ncbi:nitrate reductase molybdenum cofactor assembly chaperone [Streptomyces hoynatensis]|uniref:Nitrate reductase molybdenum cofactor assembly chaperone n=1 Tax=Streptomyces hoynatensis TaxID=1141874 RepID=A0A3A9Z779_9ACTN|nr:nitrate reductase molybdenum cofactor assembly chaperone [Streptomyces hoynatensis]RKN44080.1 nitrate reductase molybdenum cofactor assembly chaperone [Streptomyces hoynatensis]
MNSAIRQAASLLLLYPGPEWPGRLRLIDSTLRALPGPRSEPLLLLRFCEAVAGLPPTELGARYVATFDRSRRRTLHLTYYFDGDTRRRGQALLRWRSLYRTHGFAPPSDELPDFLPLALEFAARCPEAGERVLREHRAALELLRLALADHGSPYADVLSAVCRTLPGASPADRAAALRLARGGPPAESVGLDAGPAGLPHPAGPAGPEGSDAGHGGGPAGAWPGVPALTGHPAEGHQ